MKYNVTSAKTQSAAYRAIMSQKEKGAIKGIHDRLGNLGVIDSKYDIAISTASPDLKLQQQERNVLNIWLKTK